MTITVKRGAGRQAADAKTTKAAQRTPLPPKAEKTPDVWLADVVKATPELDKMTVSQLRSLAVERGLSTTTKLTRKAELIAAIEKATTKTARSTRKAASATAPAKAPGKPVQTATRQESHPERRDGSGPAKLARLTAELEPFGWKVSAKTQGNRIEATAKRGTETLRQVWVDGAYDYGASIYKDGGTVTRKIRNLSEALRLCAVKAAD